MLLAFKQITDTWVTYRNMNLRLNDLNQQRAHQFTPHLARLSRAHH